MLNNLTLGRIALLSALAMGLMACSTTSDKDISESFAAQRADVLKKVIPIHMDGYNLIGARSINSQIELTLLSAGSSDVTPTALSQSLVKHYCSDPEIYSLIEKGVTYRLVYRDARGKLLYESIINASTCKKGTSGIRTLPAAGKPISQVPHTGVLPLEGHNSGSGLSVPRTQPTHSGSGLSSMPSHNVPVHDIPSSGLITP